MTKIITRYFEDASEARAAKRELVRNGRVPSRVISVHEGTEGLAAAGVDAGAIKAYADYLAGGGAVLLVRAGYKPLGVAQLTRDVTAQMGAVYLGDIVEEVEIRDAPSFSSVLRDHPLFLTRALDSDNPNFHMADWPIPLISRRKPFRESVIPAHGRMASWPIPLLSRRKPYTGSIFSRHARMANFPLPLISKRKPYDGFAFPRHARMANFPIPLISKRKPYTGSLIPRHQRMANWPFPHLINGKTGTNALIPGAPRMANFPIPLLSDRKPKDAFAFPRHARMANFPIPLISKRKPYTGSAIPKHGRMADFPLPLVVEHGESRGTEVGNGFSFSKMLGMPTIIRR